MKKCSEKMNFDANAVRGVVSFSDALKEKVTADTPYKKALRPHFYSFASLLLSAYVSWVLLNAFFTPWILKIASKMSGAESLPGVLMSQFAYLIPLTLLSLALGRVLLMACIYGGIALNIVDVWMKRRNAK
ncbi:hypothetical protein J6836_22410 (plasmid) [Providencia sp. R33]|uniref:hypothetical protein n=1 Tax=Providencia sp. R33 TaxID=2828763 RepID=UPI001C5ACF6A|nr:hypothetical protein [Providencia sp. R33]QXX85113.1 hypothetical protein J6836_22410 [Providencia sp. R33]